MPVGKVGVSLYIDFNTLNDIETHIDGKNRSEKLCKCISKGYAVLKTQPARATR
jgi:hypothetical protein